MAVRTHHSPRRSRRWLFFAGLGLLALALWGTLSRSGPRTSRTDTAAATTAAGQTDPRHPTHPISLRDQGTLPTARRSWSEVDNPASDGWDTEVFSDRASAQLDRLGKLLIQAEELTLESLAPLVDADFSGQPLLPDDLVTVCQKGPLTIERPSDAWLANVRDASIARTGPDGLLDLVRVLVAPLHELSDRHYKFKLFRVERDGQFVTTQQYLALSGRTDQRMLEQNATWSIRWTAGSLDAAPRIVGITVTAWEQATRQSPRWFSDCTASALGGSDNYPAQLVRGYGQWLERIPHGIYLEVVGTPGLAIGDVNGDGREDLYLCQERGLPNLLLLQQPDGTLRNVAAEWGVDWLESSRAALLLDLDNDGDEDLAVSVMGGVVIASNEGHSRFRYRGLISTTEDVMSLAAADYDADGDLDIYVCGYYPDRQLDRYGDAGGEALPTGESGFVLHDANVGGANSLLRNDLSADSEDWRFTDVTRDVGLDVNNRRFTFAAAWEDYDNDGDQDLYVVNEFGRDNFYRNDGGRFADISDQARVEDAGSGMGITWGDYDRDGQMDVYISNMFSAAGNRITFQDQFKSDAPVEVKRRIQRLARGNTLLHNLGDGTFRDQSRSAGVEMGRWSWASSFVDMNNDGWQDLLVANGYITADDGGDL